MLLRPTRAILQQEPRQAGVAPEHGKVQCRCIPIAATHRDRTQLQVSACKQKKLDRFASGLDANRSSDPLSKVAAASAREKMRLPSHPAPGVLAPADRTLLTPLATQRKQDVVPASPFHPKPDLYRDCVCQSPVLPPDGWVGPATGTPRLVGHDGPSRGQGLAVNVAHMLKAAALRRFHKFRFPAYRSLSLGRHYRVTPAKRGVVNAGRVWQSRTGLIGIKYYVVELG